MIDLEVKVYVQQVSLYRARQGIILPWFPTFVTGTWLSPRATNLASNGEVRNERRLADDCSIGRVCFASMHLFMPLTSLPKLRREQEHRVQGC